MKDEWSGSRQFSVEAVGSRKPDCLFLQFSYYVSLVDLRRLDSHPGLGAISFLFVKQTIRLGNPILCNHLDRWETRLLGIKLEGLPNSASNDCAGRPCDAVRVRQ